MLELVQMLSPLPSGYGPWEAAPPNIWYLPEIAVLIDTGFADPLLCERIMAMGPIQEIVITHRHNDHIGNLVALAAGTGATVVGSSAILENHPEVALQWRANSEFLTVWESPGHAPDHLLFRAVDGTLFCGDLVLGAGTPWVGPPEGDLMVYLDTLERLLQEIPDGRLAAGHGPVQDSTHAIVRATLQHRGYREAMVWEEMEAGLADARAIASRVYNDREGMDLSGVQFEMAVWTVAGHMERIRRIGHSGTR